MSTLTNLFIISVLTALLHAAQSTCRNLVTCPCGQTGSNVTICLENPRIADDFCNKWMGCKTCQDGLFQCLTCTEGFEGKECTRISKKKAQKRQDSAYPLKKQNLKVPMSSLLNPSTTIAATSISRQSIQPNDSLNGIDVSYNSTRRVKRQSSSGENNCIDPGVILHSFVEVVLPENSGRRSSSSIEYPEGTQLIYTCEEGRILLGTSTITCEADGEWSTIPPVCSIDCGISVVQEEVSLGDRLFNGQKTVLGEWPWVVAIAQRSRGSLNIICGGSLINSKTVLTAAHCIESNSLTLYFGKTHRWDRNDDSEVEVRQSTEIIRHRQYSSVTYDNDIALIKFSPRVRFTDRIQPICLPSKETMARHLMTGQNGVVTGWGLTENDLPADELMKVYLPVLTNEDCMESYRRQNINLSLTENMFCTGFGGGKQTTCNGDSGSPLAFKDMDTGRYSVEGIVSFGVLGQCGQAGRYPAFTKVGKYASWIRRNERGSGSNRWSGE